MFLHPSSMTQQLFELRCLLAGKLVGDVLLAASFVSYAGPFNMQFRKGLVTEKWLPDLTERGIPMTLGVMPLHMLADDTKKVTAESTLPSGSLLIEAILIHPASPDELCSQQDQGIQGACACMTIPAGSITLHEGSFLRTCQTNLWQLACAIAPALQTAG